MSVTAHISNLTSSSATIAATWTPNQQLYAPLDPTNYTIMLVSGELSRNSGSISQCSNYITIDGIDYDGLGYIHAIHDGDTVSIPVRVNQSGIYTFVCIANCQDNGVVYTYYIVDTCEIEVTIDNPGIPMITIIGAATIYLNVGDSWTDPGATAVDADDNSITVTASGTVDSTTAGTYTITYTATDSSSNAAIPVSRTVIVRTPRTATYLDTPDDLGTYYYRASVADGSTRYLTNTANTTLTGEDTTPDPDTNPDPDTTSPVVILTGDATVTLTVGQSWTDPGATATDDTDATVTVIPSGTVDTTTAGTYTITYTATDTAGNTATPVTRTVIVQASTPDPDTTPDPPPQSSPQIITYTTADDDTIPPNQRIWLRAVINNGETTVTNSDVAWLTQPTVLRGIYDSNVLCLWRSGMTLSSGSRDNCFRARLELGTGTARRTICPHEITSINYSIRRLGYQTSQLDTTVSGHTSIEIANFPWVLQTPITDANWDVDTTGYNFIHWPDSSEYFPFPLSGFYEAEYTFTITNGQRLKVIFKVNVS